MAAGARAAGGARGRELGQPLEREPNQPLEREPNRRLRLGAGAVGAAGPPAGRSAHGRPRRRRRRGAEARLGSPPQPPPPARTAALRRGREGPSFSARPEPLANLGMCPLRAYGPKVKIQGSSKVVSVRSDRFSKRWWFCVRIIRFGQNLRRENPSCCSSLYPLKKKKKKKSLFIGAFCAVRVGRET